ncbi:aspartate/glutamate racemase family protein [Falsirhodobacter sp. alg1]|uniref:aspartate/glutamate racemase family protein n=1 Tax=Falsirhodobacter sp. alg1 TaxID=1472418 RepID=UPI0007896D74|nr:aspartate/glutamate racemase family protein [Falsirhodobacter sp. alg1]
MILVINPNSDQAVTDGLAAALVPYGPHFHCISIPDSPATISTAEDVARSGLRVLEVAAEYPRARAIITACFSDPGLDLLRAAGRTAFGIQECGILTAMARADRFGIIALSPRSVPRHTVRMRQMGVLDRLAGEVALSGASALEAGTSPVVLEETLEAGATLVSMGAGAIVLGCAGFAPRRRLLEERLGVPVIDPAQAAAVMALGAVLA